jgi:hypothetical protein
MVPLVFNSRHRDETKRPLFVCRSVHCRPDAALQPSHALKASMATTAADDGKTLALLATPTKPRRSLRTATPPSPQVSLKTPQKRNRRFSVFDAYFSPGDKTAVAAVAVASQPPPRKRSSCHDQSAVCSGGGDSGNGEANSTGSSSRCSSTHTPDSSSISVCSSSGAPIDCSGDKAADGWPREARRRLDLQLPASGIGRRPPGGAQHDLNRLQRAELRRQQPEHGVSEDHHSTSQQQRHHHNPNPTLSISTESLESLPHHGPGAARSALLQAAAALPLLAAVKAAPSPARLFVELRVAETGVTLGVEVLSAWRLAEVLEFCRQIGAVDDCGSPGTSKVDVALTAETPQLCPLCLADVSGNVLDERWVIGESAAVAEALRAGPLVVRVPPPPVAASPEENPHVQGQQQQLQSKQQQQEQEARRREAEPKAVTRVISAAAPAPNALGR